MTIKADPTPMTPLKSSMLSGYHYDPTSKRLTIEYSSGHRYQHDGVHPDRVKGLAEAKSVGSFFNMHIKPHYPAAKVQR